MNDAADPRDTEAWAHRVLIYHGPEQYRQILDELVADQVAAGELLDRLSRFSHPVVRAWAGTASTEVFGAEAIPLLTRLLKDRDPDVRDVARQDLIALDPTFLRTQFPAYRRALKRRKDPWGEDRSAMYALARARDPEAAPLLRDYASHYATRYWHNRMPLVLADYIEDPGSVVRRIRAHDHDFMFWLIDGAAILDIPNTREALAGALELPLDDDCAALVRRRLPAFG